MADAHVIAPAGPATAARPERPAPDISRAEWLRLARWARRLSWVRAPPEGASDDECCGH